MLFAAIAPSPLVSISPSWFTFGLVLVVAFAWTRPLTVRDFEQRRLPVNVTAQLVFVLFYCLAYLTLVLAIHYARPLVSEFFTAVGAIEFATQYLQPRTDASGGFAPLFSLTILCWFQSINMLREVERAALVSVYSARYQFTDVRDLGTHLAACAFTPTAEERARNRQVLERLNVFLTDSDTRSIDLKMISDWRKVETLLRHIDVWKAEGQLSLTSDELDLLERMRTAHERKTALALNIIRMLGHIGRGAEAAETLHQVSDLLKTAQHGSRSEIEAAEARLLEATAMPADGVPSLRLSSGQLKQFLKQIESYFEEEYRIIVGHVSELAAKAVVHANDAAGERLQAIKGSGFAGIGELLTIKFDRILWVFAATFLASLMLFLFRASMMQVLGERSTFNAQQQLMMIATISLTIAFATIVGAFVGSTRELAQAPRAPWATYCLAGLVAVFLFFVVHTTRAALIGPSPLPAERPAVAMLQAAGNRVEPAAAPAAAPRAGARQGAARDTAAALRPQAPFARPPTVRQALPWAVVPFLMTVGICLLARISRWPVPDRWQQARYERALDGLALGAVMVIAMVVVQRGVYPALEAFPELQIRRPPHLVEALSQSFIPINMLLVQLGIGFAIGAMVLRDVRRAGHSRIVETPLVRPRTPLGNAALKSAPLPGADVLPVS